jgi:predicted Zn-dependent protease
MKKTFVTCAMIITVLLYQTAASGQVIKTFHHPSLNITFRADENWINIAHPENELIYEIADPDTIVRVLLYYEASDQAGPEYLNHMARTNNLVYEGKPTKGIINEREAWVLDATCCRRQLPVRVVLAAIPCTMEDDGLVITQLCCPEDKLAENKDCMEEILYSVQILDKEK